MKFFRSVRVTREPEQGWMRRVKRAAAPRVRPEVQKLVVPWVPEALLIDALTRYGMPRRHAVLVSTSTRLYVLATRLYLDSLDAEAGDAEAKARLDHFQAMQERLKTTEREQLGRDPDRSEPVKAGRSTSSIVVPRNVDAT